MFLLLYFQEFTAVPWRPESPMVISSPPPPPSRHHVRFAETSEFRTYMIDTDTEMKKTGGRRKRKFAEWFPSVRERLFKGICDRESPAVLREARVRKLKLLVDLHQRCVKMAKGEEFVEEEDGLDVSDQLEMIRNPPSSNPHKKLRRKLDDDEEEVPPPLLLTTPPPHTHTS